MAQAVGHSTGVLQSFALGQEYLDGKLVAVGIGELAHLQVWEDQAGGNHQHQGQHHGEVGIAEGPCQHLLVDVLNVVGEGFLAPGFVCG